MNAQQLKNSILQEAIQGRLVPQDPNDKPASVLLERIRKEKAKLVKEGKLKKKDLEVTPISDDEKPFDIPKSWEWVRLGFLVDFSKSSSVKSENIGYTDWILDLEDIEKDTGKLLRKKTKNEADSKSDKHQFYSGNVLYSKLRPYLNKVIIADSDGYCTSEIIAFDFGEIYNKYAQFYLMSPFFVCYAMSGAYGVKMPRLGSKQGNEALFPLPPLQEQHRIVEKIEELLPKVEEYGKAQDALDKLNKDLPEQFKKSVLQEAIQGRLVPQDPNDEPASVLLERIRKEKAKLVKEGKLKKKDLEVTPISDDEKPFEIPESWEWVRIYEIGTSQLGKTLDKGKQSGKEYPYLCSINVYWDGICLDNVKTFLLKEDELLRYKLQKGDLLVCEGGDYGRCSVWDKDIEMYYQNALHRLRFYNGISANFYKYIFEFYRNSNYIVGQGQTIKHFTYANMKTLSFPLPPLQEQHRIVEKLESILSEIEKLK